MADAASPKPERGDADTTAGGLSERTLERTPSYIKTVTESPDEATDLGRPARADLDVPRESLAERIARNRLDAEPLRSPSYFTAPRPQFTLTNSHWTPISVALTGRDDACENECGSGEYVTGWFELAPAETLTWPNPNREWRIYYYAEATDGSVYEGYYIHALVMNVQFRICLCNQHHIPPGHTPWYDAGFEELNLNQFSGVTFC